MTDEGSVSWQKALLAARILAAGRSAIGGLHLRARAGPVRDAWLDYLKEHLPPAAAWRRITPNVPVGRLIGGLDLAKTLEMGKPRLEPGLLSACDGGVLVLSMAERSAGNFAATIGAAMDEGGVRVERNGLSLFQPTCFTLVCLDEGADEDEQLPAALSDRVALSVDLSAVSCSDIEDMHCSLLGEAAPIADWPTTKMSAEMENALESAVVAFGERSLRTSIAVRRVSRLIAALNGSDSVTDEHAALALQLVCPMMVVAPSEEEKPVEAGADQPQPQDDLPPDDSDRSEADTTERESGEVPSLNDILVAAKASAAVDLSLGDSRRAAMNMRNPRGSGKSGIQIKSGHRGRPVGISSTPPWPGARLNVPATLRAAAPWQKARQRQRREAGRPTRARLDLRQSDFRYQRLLGRTETTAILCVDASGSTALERLGEAKGAAELLLAECYVRRDSVAVVGFRGTGSDVMLPPTRSLVRAKKCLASLVGGGGTPLAAGMVQALHLAVTTARHGQKPLVVMMTDGSTNIALDGTANRSRALSDAQQVAGEFRARGIAAIVVDIAFRTRDTTKSIAASMDADYYALPRADAHAVSSLVVSHLRAS
ncbi:MAG: magnesium chelatase subunit D [Pseudomonadota bacterium]